MVSVSISDNSKSIKGEMYSNGGSWNDIYEQHDVPGPSVGMPYGSVFQQGNTQYPPQKPLNFVVNDHMNHNFLISSSDPIRIFANDLINDVMIPNTFMNQESAFQNNILQEQECMFGNVDTNNYHRFLYDGQQINNLQNNLTKSQGNCQTHTHPNVYNNQQDHKQNLKKRSPGAGFYGKKYLNDINATNYNMNTFINTNQQTQNQIMNGPDMNFGYPMQHGGSMNIIPQSNNNLNIKVPMAPIRSSSMEIRRPPAPLLLPFHHKNDNRVIPQTFANHAGMISHYSLEEIQESKNLFMKKFNDLDFTNITVVELKGFLREFGLASGGRKDDLISRIKQIHKYLLNENNGSPTGNDQFMLYNNYQNESFN